MYQVDEKGFYGQFGGAYIPEMLIPNIEELKRLYLKILESQSFKTEYHRLLRDYAGRPSPLFKAERLSQKYGANILAQAGGSEPHRQS